MSFDPVILLLAISLKENEEVLRFMPSDGHAALFILVRH